MFRRFWLPSVLAFGPLTITPAAAADSLATPMTGQPVQELWPIHLEIEIARQQTADRPAAVLARHRAQVPDGHELHFESVVTTGRGRREFALNVTPRHHPDAQVELEWNFEVIDSPYRPVDVGSYLLHRMQLSHVLAAPVLRLAPPSLKIARADIVTAAPTGWRSVVQIDGEPHEIRILARSARG